MKRKKEGDHILEGDVNRDLDNDLDVNDFALPVVPTQTPRRTVLLQINALPRENASLE